MNKVRFDTLCNLEKIMNHVKRLRLDSAIGNDLFLHSINYFLTARYFWRLIFLHKNL